MASGGGSGGLSLTDARRDALRRVVGAPILRPHAEHVAVTTAIL